MILIFLHFRWTIRKDTGHLIAYRLKKEDEGEYTCIAENNAGRIESKTFLDVIIKPKVQELFNKTYAVNNPEGRIVCKASGDPLPEIIFKVNNFLLVSLLVDSMIIK